MKEDQGQQIRVEHVALNVSAPVEMARWYAANLDMQIVREGPPPINSRFIADAGGHTMIEVYTNPPDAVPDYTSMDPLQLHLAFMVDDVEAIRSRLIEAGATPVDTVTVTVAGDRLAILRDPWGLAIQLVCRANPMLTRD
jgi:glyoxylase I family protein